MLDFLQFRGPWDVVQLAAWVVSIALLLWMLWDAIRVSKQYSEDVLTSSQEGVDELALQQDAHKKS
ncbi:hypothetical protein A8950_1595 [Dongia mobilis]|jgi:hypothetical protein|uniref:Uncharacterized protein n=1 Tax=Dongia mobilis TaxID=578943 RepID=A0A4R6WU32_9PROT|nr:hypothetical protein [Dongia mobilis]TDQ83309.1 hypothetical protein A8950_1595 [Dongia mobilis]